MDLFVESDGAKLWTNRRGNGPAMMLLNGSACSDYLSPVAEMLMSKYTVIRFEPRGCGRSDWDGRYDLRTLTSDIEAIRSAYGAPTMLLCGHSMGVNHALVYAMDHPDRARGVIGIAGGNFVNDRDWHRDYDAGLAAGGDETGDLKFSADDALLTFLNQEWKAFIKQPDTFRRLKELSVPCVLIGAGADIRPNWPIQQLVQLVEHGDYLEIPDGTHYPWLSNPARVKDTLDAALDLLEQPTRSLNT